MEELKACPFCGCKTIIVYNADTYWASCPRCNSTSGSHKSAEKAFEAWNRRVDER